MRKPGGRGAGDRAKGRRRRSKDATVGGQGEEQEDTGKRWYKGGERGCGNGYGSGENWQ